MAPRSTEDSTVNTSIRNVFVYAFGLVAAAATATAVWIKHEERVAKLEVTVAENSAAVKDIPQIKAQVDAQLVILRWMANGQKGPLPEAAKEPK